MLRGRMKRVVGRLLQRVVVAVRGGVGFRIVDRVIIQVYLIVRFEPAVVVANCWPNNATLAVAVASASVGCCLGVVTGLFAGGGDHDR